MKKYLLIAMLAASNCTFGMELEPTKYPENIYPNIRPPFKRQKVMTDFFPEKQRISNELHEEKLQELYRVSRERGNFPMLEQLRSWIANATCEKDQAMALYFSIVRKSKFCTQIKFSACLDMLACFSNEKTEVAQHLVFLLHNQGEDMSHQLLAAEKLLDLFKDSSKFQDLKEKGVTFLEDAKMVCSYIDFMEIVDTFLKYNIYTQTQAVDSILGYTGGFSSLRERAEMLAYLFKNAKLADFPEKEDLLGLILRSSKSVRL